MKQHKNKKTIEELEDLVRIQGERINLLQKEIIELENSLLGYFFNIYGACIEVVSPQGTYRRKILNAVVRFFKKKLSVPETLAINKKTPPILFSTTPIGSFNEEFPCAAHPIVSIIVLTYNNLEFTYQCVANILKHTDLPYELIIVDNNSQDGTREFLRRLHNVTMVYNDVNVGFSKGCNQGAARAKGKYLIFLNNDAVVTKGWVRPLVKTVEEKNNCGAVGGKILSFDGRIQEAGGVVGRDGSCRVLGRGLPSDIPAHNIERVVDHCTAACVLVRKDVFERVGGFDESYSPAYYEDVDLCMKIQNEGFILYYQPKSTVYHNQNTSSTKKDVRKLMVRNKKLFKNKWKHTLKKKKVNTSLD